MNENTIKELREALLERWTRIGKRGDDKDKIAVRHGITVDPAGPQAEIIDIAQALEELGRETSLAEQERKELVAIERALAKMATGNFGVCEDCGEDIPSRRLMVLPEARLCAHCQTYEERQNSRRATGLPGR